MEDREHCAILQVNGFLPTWNYSVEKTFASDDPALSPCESGGSLHFCSRLLV
jgi:hypothetical protein